MKSIADKEFRPFAKGGEFPVRAVGFVETGYGHCAPRVVREVPATGSGLQKSSGEAWGVEEGDKKSRFIRGSGYKMVNCMLNDGGTGSATSRSHNVARGWVQDNVHAGGRMDGLR